MALAMGLCVGAVSVALLWGEAWAQAWALREALLVGQAEHPPVVPRDRVDAASAAAPAQGADRPWMGPGLASRDAAWWWLQQRLQAQGLQLESLRPEALQTGAPLASQAAQLRLHGAWPDWVAFGQQLLAHAPWWSWEQWQVQPAALPGQVQVEARLRLWLRPDPVSAEPERRWPVWPAASTRVALPLFATATAPDGAVPAVASASSPAWRLWGHWTQGNQRHVVLGRGAEWTVLAPGQTWGTEAYRVERIGAEGLHLTSQRAGRAVWLPWEGAP